jgi:hypothetical protein
MCLAFGIHFFAQSDRESFQTAIYRLFICEKAEKKICWVLCDDYEGEMINGNWAHNDER